LRVTGGSGLSRGRGCFSGGGLLDFAGDALPEALVEPELLDELDDREDDPLLDEDLDLLPDELSDPLQIITTPALSGGLPTRQSRQLPEARHGADARYFSVKRHPSDRIQH